MTGPYISVDLATTPSASVTFWILSDYDTGFAKVIGEQSNITVMHVAQFTDRLARKHGAEEVLVDVTGLGAGLADVLIMISGRPYQVIKINPAAKKEAAA